MRIYAILMLLLLASAMMAGCKKQEAATPPAPDNNELKIPANALPMELPPLPPATGGVQEYGNEPAQN